MKLFNCYFIYFLFITSPFVYAEEFKIFEKDVKYSILYIFPQERESLITSPINAIYDDGNILFLGSKISRILVFNDKKHSHSIGSPGMGPGDIFNPKSFCICNDLIYVLNEGCRIEVFNKQGQAVKSIKLEIVGTLNIFAITDFKVHGNHIYVSFGKGETKLIKFDLNGRFIENVISFGQDKELIPNGYFSNYRLSIFNDTIIFVDQSSSRLEVYGLYSKKLLSFMKSVDPDVMQKYHEAMKEKSAGQNHLMKFIVARISFDEENGIVNVLPLTQDKDRPFYFFYEIHIQNNVIVKNRMFYPNSKQEKIRFAFRGKNNDVYLIDGNYDMFKIIKNGG